MITSRPEPGKRPPAGGTVSAEYLRLIGWAAEARGLVPAQVFGAAGIDPAVLAQRGTRVSIGPVSRAWEQIVQRLGDPLFGLRLVEALPFGSGDILDYLLRSSATVAQALQGLVRFAPLMNDADHLTFMMSGDEARLRFRTSGDVPYTCEMVAGIFARRAREMFGPSWALRGVSFAHASQGASVVYDRVFQAPAQFDAPFNEIVFSRELIEQPMPGADPRLNAILTSQADALIAGLAPPPTPSSFVDAVEQALADGLAEGDGTLTRVADQLQLSTRTVQRRLREAGVSHRAVIRRLRLEMASRSLGGGASLSQGEIARALGYSGVGSFHRAFKRWSGMTPGQVRAQRERGGQRNGDDP
jgi:AraC-like DNA-binding protein